MLCHHQLVSRHLEFHCLFRWCFCARGRTSIRNDFYLWFIIGQLINGFCFSFFQIGFHRRIENRGQSLTYLVGVSFPFCVLLELLDVFDAAAAAALLLDVIGEITADLPATVLTVLLRCCAVPPIVLANNANWPRRAPADFKAVNIFCCCTERLFTCELFNCHDCMLWRDTFNRLPVDWLLAFWTDDNDGNIIIGDGLRSILINFKPLKCSTFGLKCFVNGFLVWFDLICRQQSSVHQNWLECVLIVWLC